MSDPLPICCFGAYHTQVEELRVVLLNSVSAVGQLARVLQQGDDWLRIVAASALGNLAACRADVKDVRPQVWQSAVHKECGQSLQWFRLAPCGITSPAVISSRFHPRCRGCWHMCWPSFIAMHLRQRRGQQSA